MTALPAPFEATLAAFAPRPADPAQARAPWLAARRADALAAFRAAGIPTHENEEWRFTRVDPIARATYTPAPGAVADGAAVRAVEEASLGLAGGPHLVFLNGRWSKDLSVTTGLPAGVHLSGLREALASGGPLLEAHLGRQIEIQEHPFAALNSALWEDGACLHLAAGTHVPDPIRIVFLTTPGAGAMTSPRVLVIAEAGAQATVVECYGPLAEEAGGADGNGYFTNAVTEVALGEGAIVDHVKLQLESDGAFHLAATAARLAKDSRYTSRSISAGGAIVRNDLIAVLGGEGAECSLDGLFLATGAQHVDNHTTIDHAKPHGTSRETYKGILGGRARGVFDGKIIVRADAQKTDSRQVNRNLLLSDAALINTKPQLEINADDVKCAHAATIGRLDEASLFYLRSRGLGYGHARALLIEAFAGEVVGRITLDSLRLRIGRMVHALAVSEAAGGIGEAA
jgi:Fe-S cluster assembly protein SufD